MVIDEMSVLTVLTLLLAIETNHLLPWVMLMVVRVIAVQKRMGT